MLRPSQKLNIISIPIQAYKSQDDKLRKLIQNRSKFSSYTFMDKINYITRYRLTHTAIIYQAA